MATTIPDIFEHDIGTIFECEIKNLVNAELPSVLDISGATEKLVIFKKPDGTEAEYPGEFSTDGEDGKLRYTTATASVLVLTDQTATVEIWEYYGWIKYPGGERRSSSVKFKLYPGRKSQDT